MVVRDLDEHDPDTVGVGDPHLDQAPRLPLRRTQYLHIESLEPLMLLANVAHLQPQRHRPWAAMPPEARHFEEAPAEEEDHAAMRGVAELAINGESEHVPVETPRALQLGGPHQNAAGKYVHLPMMAHRTQDGRASDRSARRTRGHPARCRRAERRLRPRRQTSYIGGMYARSR
jgi:hypothetical protein